MMFILQTFCSLRLMQLSCIAEEFQLRFKRLNNSNGLQRAEGVKKGCGYCSGKIQRLVPENLIRA